MASKYKDPAPVRCPKCSEQSEYSVADLLAFQTRCATCGESLAQIGLEMRSGLDGWADHVAKMLMQIRLEEHLGVTFSDDEVGAIKTLRDLTNLIVSRLEAKGTPSSNATELTRWAVAELQKHPLWDDAVREHGVLDFDAPLLEVLDPGRWDYSKHTHRGLRRIRD